MNFTSIIINKSSLPFYHQQLVTIFLFNYIYKTKGLCAIFYIMTYLE